MPKLQGMIIDLGGYGVNDVSIAGISEEINFSFLLPILCFAFIAMYGRKNSA
jgi:FHS family L-fucose permease-like MFS transporter